MVRAPGWLTVILLSVASPLTWQPARGPDVLYYESCWENRHYKLRQVSALVWEKLTWWGAKMGDDCTRRERYDVRTEKGVLSRAPPSSTTHFTHNEVLL